MGTGASIDEDGVEGGKALGDMKVSLCSSSTPLVLRLRMDVTWPCCSSWTF